MRHLLTLLIICISVCEGLCQQVPDNKQLSQFFQKNTEEDYKYNPLQATTAGVYTYNDQLPITFTDSYQVLLKQRLVKRLAELKKFDRKSLNANDKISYDISLRNLEMALEGISLKTNRIPFSQLSGLQQQLAQLGAGTGAQPFKTVKDYENWISRASKFSQWADSAIAYFRMGIAEGYVLPKTLVVKIIPQMKALQSDDFTKSVFYGPVNKFPESFKAADKTRFTEAYRKLIIERLNPAYKKLADFMENEYLLKARTTSGLASLPNGKKLYDFAIRTFTTTTKSPDELFNTGLTEVKRICDEMDRIREQVNYEGTLDSFFNYVKTDPKFLPYKTAEEVLDAYRAIQSKIEPHLNKIVSLRPKTAFEIRQVEAFRAASASASYSPGLTDGTRPGIFFVPIVDATKYTTAKENLFIHEAIPGHHFQVMLQKENKSLPKFRQEGFSSAYGEGWALYCESLGKMLGCYTDPYQQFYALGDEMHRAIRLVVDAGIHSKGWTRERAIEYMRKNEPITEQSATSEIERYMANPGQALSYKVGELKIKEMKDRYQKKLGSKFSIVAFHDELLKDGSMPLSTLEAKMDSWAWKQIGVGNLQGPSR